MGCNGPQISNLALTRVRIERADWIQGLLGGDRELMPFPLRLGRKTAVKGLCVGGIEIDPPL